MIVRGSIDADARVTEPPVDHGVGHVTSDDRDCDFRTVWNALDQDEAGSESRSGYRVEFTYPVEELIGDLLSGERGDPRLQATIPFLDWYNCVALRRFQSWGPDPLVYPPLPELDRRTADWKRQRLIAVAMRFVGYGYQHHHIPDWSPPADWPWKQTCAGRNGKGVDCSNFTGFVYNQGFGIRLITEVAQQAKRELALESQLGPAIRIERIELPERFEDRVNILRSGDLVYIRHSLDDKVSHVVVWVGPIGRALSGAPLVIDSHGKGVTNDHGQQIPSGIQLRPFREDSWYNQRGSHAHRIFSSDPE